MLVGTVVVPAPLVGAPSPSVVSEPSTMAVMYSWLAVCSASRVLMTP
jgi:hypothetical protein